MPADLTVGQFVYVIRKRIKLSPDKAIFIFVDEVLPPTAALMSSIYEEHKDEDGYARPLLLSPAPFTASRTELTRPLSPNTGSYTSRILARTPSEASSRSDPAGTALHLHLGRMIP